MQGREIRVFAEIAGLVMNLGREISPHSGVEIVTGEFLRRLGELRTPSLIVERGSREATMCTSGGSRFLRYS